MFNIKELINIKKFNIKKFNIKKFNIKELNIKELLFSNIKKLLFYIVLFFIIFSTSSFVMLSLKVRTERELGEIYSKQLLKKLEESESMEQLDTKEASIMFRQLSPEKIDEFLSELSSRVDLYGNKIGLLDQKEREMDSFRADLESQKEELVSMRGKLSEALLLVSRERVALDSDLVVFDENERKNLKHLAAVYASMEASKAADILSQLNSDTGAKVLVIMPSKKAANILAEIVPTGAAKFTEQMRKLEIADKASGEALKQKNLKKLATIYQSIEANKAVSIIEKLDDETTVSILSYMDEKKLAKILDLVQSEKASELTEKIRNKIKQKGKTKIKGA